MNSNHGCNCNVGSLVLSWITNGQSVSFTEFVQNSVVEAQDVNFWRYVQYLSVLLAKNSGKQWEVTFNFTAPLVESILRDTSHLVLSALKEYPLEAIGESVRGDAEFHKGYLEVLNEPQKELFFNLISDLEDYYSRG